MTRNTVFGFLTGLALCNLMAFDLRNKESGCAIMLDKNNVIYIGLDNPATIIAQGVFADDLQVEAQGISVIRESGNRYTFRATTPGKATVTLSGGGMEPVTLNYRVKRIPDPVPRLGGRHLSRSIGNGEFKAQNGIAAVLDGFDFDARCSTIDYWVTYITEKSDAVTVKNTGARFNEQVGDLIRRAKPGDIYVFDDIRAKCPGDVMSRNLASLVFKIK